MEAKATVTGVRVTPRKARLVIDLVRGKDVSVALGILANVNKYFGIYIFLISCALFKTDDIALEVDSE